MYLKYNSILTKHQDTVLLYSGKKVHILIRETTPRNSTEPNGIAFDLAPDTEIPKDKRGFLNGYYRMLYQKSFTDESIEKNISKLFNKCKELIDTSMGAQPIESNSNDLDKLKAIQSQVRIDINTEEYLLPRGKFGDTVEIVSDAGDQYFVVAKVKLKGSDTIKLLRYIAALSGDKNLIKRTL